ncbi:hypothetical protein [Stieleria varia]|uniref:Uncharacterized protein n=1 Tax=Stieleria varia TaxID=2528005 RepID=A0A5C6A3C8_9BACT|nr:hypothetical protein [Stieleria varia]TWT93758.1 hypothetical protein Pla52n_55860 [Stieleria varia]
MAKFSQVQFKPSVDLSAIHAAYVVATGAACTDERTENLLVKPAAELNTRLLSSSIDIPMFWHSLYAAYAAGESEQTACESALSAGGCSELQLEQTGKAVARLVAECTGKFKKRFPKLEAQLELRANPLKTKWETCGPGLLIQSAALIWDSTPPTGWWPAKIHGWLVQPIRGGDGQFDAKTQRFWIEAMLTDGDPRIPEVLRVGWLVTQLAIARNSGTKVADSSGRMPWGLGTIPIVLAAGAELDLVHGPLPIADTVRWWRMGDDAIAKILIDWWGQWRQTKTSMPVALKALDKMLQSTRQPFLQRKIDLSDIEDEL